MFGIEVVEILLFFRQVSIAVVGATTFWGCVFLFLSKKSNNDRKSALWQGSAQKLLWVFFPSLILYGIIWVIIAITLCTFCAIGHEGISQAQEASYMPLVFQKQFSLFLSLMLAGIAGAMGVFFSRKFLFRRLPWLYGFSFITISVILVYPWEGFYDINNSISSSIHGWHQILTLGSVLVVDFLYISLRHNLKDLLPKIFSMVSFGIWIGLGLDFLSSGLVFGDEFSLTGKTLFMQTLIGIIIVNGVLLGGPITRAILAFQRRMQTEVVSSNLHRIVGISGSISLVIG